MTTAELLLSIRADASSALAGLKSTSTAVKEVESTSASAGVKASGFFANMGGELKKIGTIAAGLALGNIASNFEMGVAERFKTAAEQIDVYGKAVLSVQRISGESAESSSLLVAMFQRYAGSIDEATTRLARFEKTLAGQEDAIDVAANGGKTAAAWLAEFGVQANDATGHLKPTVEILYEMADGFAASTDSAAKMGALTAVFGRGSQDMLLMLNQGRAGLEEFAASAKKYGLILSKDNVEDVYKFTVAHKNLDMALQGVSIQLGAAFMPSITKAAEQTASFAQAIASVAVPALKAFGDLKIDWLIPATSSALLLSVAYKALAFVTAPLFSMMGALGGAVAVQGTASTVAAVENVGLAAALDAVAASSLIATGILDAQGNMIMREGGLATAAAAENTALAASEVAVGATATAAATGVGVMASASAGLGVVVASLRGALTAFAGTGLAAFLMLSAAVLIEWTTIKATITNFKWGVERWGAPDWVKNFADWLPGDSKPAPGANPREWDKLPGTSTLLPESTTDKNIRGATADKTAAEENLKKITEEADLRKIAFDKSHFDDETKLLQVKMANANADQATLDVKRKIEDLDRNAIDYTLKRLQLNEQDAVTKAKIAESGLKNNADDLTYQQQLLVAQVKAARAAHEHIDMAGMRKQMKDLKKQEIEQAPALLIAEHQVSTADRTKGATDLNASLTATALDRQKLVLEESNAQKVEAAIMDKRAVEDAQAKLELAKQQFAIDGQDSALKKLDAEAAAKKTALDLWILQHPVPGATATPAITSGLSPVSPAELAAFVAAAKASVGDVSVGAVTINVQGGATGPDTIQNIKDSIGSWFKQAVDAAGNSDTAIAKRRLGGAYGT